MLPQEIIRKTRNHEPLSTEEISFFIKKMTTGEIADIQAASWSMANGRRLSLHRWALISPIPRLR